MSGLDRFLEQKGAEYAPFDAKRAHRIYAVLKPHLEELYAQSATSKKDSKILTPQSGTQHNFSPQNKPFIIHILGTNGKGSTGRFITLGLAQNGYKALHFTSPHLFRFNERFYLANIPNSDFSAKSSSAKMSQKDCVFTKDCDKDALKATHRIADDSELEIAHLWLQRFPVINESSYFEYATFLALYLAKDCDYFVCEAGLGGEFDSTSVLQADLSVFTPISFDHQDMLGNTIESIATTKLKAMSKRTLLAPQIHKEVQSIAQSIAKQKGAELTFVENIFDDFEAIVPLAHLPANFNEYSQNLAPFLKQNLFVAYRVLESIGIGVDFARIGRFDLPARAQYIAPNILVDVGHNAHCAHSILQIVKQKRVILVYNTFFDKDASAILGILKPAIERLLILEVSHSRILPKDKLINIAQNLGITYGIFEGVDSMRADRDYVVFGSFSVVKTFMEIYNVAR